MNRNLCQKLVIFGVSVALGIFACLLLDFFVISPLTPETDDQYGYVGYEDGWYTLAPNVRVASAWGETVFPWRTDANGFRIDHHQISASRPADLIFLGDSFTFGIGLPWEDTFVGIYERTSRRPVINAGVTSYSPTAYLWQYKRAISAGALRASHVVIVAIDISDVQDEAAIWEEGQDHPRKRDRASSSPQPIPRIEPTLKSFLSSRLPGTRSIYRMIRYWLFSGEETTQKVPVTEMVRSSFTWRPWSEIEPRRASGVRYEQVGYQPLGVQGGRLAKIREMLATISSIPWENKYEQVGYQPLGVRGGLAKIRERLATISSIARENKSDLWILIYPWPAQLLHPSAIFDWEKFNVDMCHDIQCRGVINTFPRFRLLAGSNDWYEKLFIHGDVHFNKFGNQVIADEIMAAVK